MVRPIQIAPSILSADFGRLAEEIQAAEAAGADLIHVDVMDGRYVPNITIGPVVIKAARKAATKPLDVHLMMVEPEKYIEVFADAGADIITVQAEAVTHLHRCVHQIKDTGKKAGVALNPHTPPEVLRYLLDDIDLVLCMTVNPGFGGQKFIENVVSKVRTIKDWLDAHGRGEDVDLEVDGGINPSTAIRVATAGANIFVAGSAVFDQPDYAKAISDIRAGAEQVRKTLA